MSDYHTTLDFVLINTTEEQTYVVTSFTCIQQLAEHFNTCDNRLLIFAQAQDLYFVTNLNNTGFDTTSCYSTTTCDREYVLNRHQERLLNVTDRFLNPAIASCHQFHNFSFPLSNAIQSTKSRTTDDRSLSLEIISSQKLTHFHFYQLQHFLVVHHVTFVQEYNQAGNVYLTSQQDMLTSLRHRTVSRSNYDNSTVHLSSTSYHVLYIVGMTRAVYVRIVTISSFVFYVRSINSDTTLLFFGGVVNLIK